MKPYPRRILLAVTGLSPQIITETLYALRNDTHRPNEIHLITTMEGAQRAELTLLSEEPGWFKRFCKDYQWHDLCFNTDSIHILRNADGQLMDDIRTLEDNECTADFITDTVRQLTNDPNAMLHVSIAGGRKTMGFYLGYALSLYGRPQDQLSHVLVTAPFESNPKFYYPTPYHQVIYSREPNSSPIDSHDAKITLANIPFVRLREGLPDLLISGQAHFSNVVMTAQEALQPSSLSFDLPKHQVHCGSHIITLPPASFALYAWLAKRRQQDKTPVRWSDQGWQQEFLEIYAKTVGEFSGVYQRVAEALADENGFKDYFEQRKSKTNQQLRLKLGQPLAKPYLIKAYGSRPTTRYGLEISTQSIYFKTE